MVWHIRGSRILTNSEARAEDSRDSYPEWLGLAGGCFVMSWWLFAGYEQAFGAAIIVGVVVGVLAYFFEDVVVPWGIYFCVGVLGWKALHWGRDGILAVAGALCLFIWFWGDMLFSYAADWETSAVGHKILRVLLVITIGGVWYFNLTDPLLNLVAGLL